MSPMLRNITLAGSLALIAGLGYMIFFGGGGDETLLTVEGIGSTQVLSIEDQVFLNRLQELQTIKMDTSILNDERFVSLANFRRELVDENTGRPNPFRPIVE